MTRALRPRVTASLAVAPATVTDRTAPMPTVAPHAAHYLRNRGVFDEALAVGVCGLDRLRSALLVLCRELDAARRALDREES